MTVLWHVDDMKISHKMPDVVTSFMEYIKKKYGSIGKVKITRGKKHEYLGMTLDYLEPKKVKIDKTKYVKNDMITEFPDADMQGTSVTPANDNLFKVNEHSPHWATKRRKASIQWLLKDYLWESGHVKRYRQPSHSFVQGYSVQPRKIGTN